MANINLKLAKGGQSYIITYITMRILFLIICLVAACADTLQSPQPLGRQHAPSLTA